jgi:hypothetical protein
MQGVDFVNATSPFEMASIGRLTSEASKAAIVAISTSKARGRDSAVAGIYSLFSGLDYIYANRKYIRRLLTSRTHHTLSTID